MTETNSTKHLTEAELIQKATDYWFSGEVDECIFWEAAQARMGGPAAYYAVAAEHSRICRERSQG